MEKSAMGFKEISHTADRCIAVWAPDLPRLLMQAAAGMYQMMEIDPLSGEPAKKKMELEAASAEELLVLFLSELLYLLESSQVVFDHLDLGLEGLHLHAEMQGKQPVRYRNEIKAVTYHKLAIRQTRQGLEAEIVFDV
jgi:SHS2 domain-containing protein